MNDSTFMILQTFQIVILELDEVIGERNQQQEVGRDVKTGHRNPHILITTPLRGKLDWAIIFMFFYFEDWSMKLRKFCIGNYWKKILKLLI